MKSQSPYHWILKNKPRWFILFWVLITLAHVSLAYYILGIGDHLTNLSSYNDLFLMGFFLFSFLNICMISDSWKLRYKKLAGEAKEK